MREHDPDENAPWRDDDADEDQPHFGEDFGDAFENLRRMLRESWDRREDKPDFDPTHNYTLREIRELKKRTGAMIVVEGADPSACIGEDATLDLLRDIYAKESHDETS